MWTMSSRSYEGRLVKLNADPQSNDSISPSSSSLSKIQFLLFHPNLTLSKNCPDYLEFAVKKVARSKVGALECFDFGV